MTIRLRQSTASQEIPLGYFVDSTDGNTEETALTIANTDIKLWKAGATTLANKNSGGATHISNGIYYATLDATDTDTVGPLVIFCHVSGALTVRLECEVLEEAVYDAFYAASAPGYVANAPVNVAQISGDSVAADNCESFFDGTGYAGTNNVIPTVTTLTGHTPQTGDAYARLGAPAGASVSADIAAVKSDTAAILLDTGTDGVVVAAGSKTGYSLSATQTFDLTGNITGNLSGSVGSVTGAVGSVTGNVGGNVAGSVASVTAGVTVTTNNDKTGYALSATGSAALTEGYASLGAAATLPQILYEIRALLAEKSISSTTLTTKKLDGTTTAATYTLDDATTPSAITRST